MTEDKAASPKPKEPAWRALRENIEAVVIAFTFALIIRCFFIEVFEIPTSSMEPTLLGQDPELRMNDGRPVRGAPYRDYHTGPGGDRIMVTKFYYGLGSIERFDVVVFKFPLNIGKNFIKRVVGLPAEEFMVHRGNLYTRPLGDESGPFRIAAKTIRTQDSLWIRVGEREGFLRDPETFKDYWAVPGAGEDSTPPYEIRGKTLTTLGSDGRAVSFRYRRRIVDYPEEDDAAPIDDLNLSMEFELTQPQSRFAAQIDNRYGSFSVRLGGREPNVLLVHRGDRVHTITLPGRVDPDRFHRLELMTFDGLAAVRLNGETTSYRFLETRQEAELEHRSREIIFGVEGGSISVRNLRLRRDVHYKIKGSHSNLREGVALSIPPGNYLMMGDNTERSQDSRAWTRVEYRLKDGRSVVCEKVEQLEGFQAREAAVERGIEPVPDVVIKADEYGNFVALYDGEIDGTAEEAGAPFVHERYIVGKALWIWWPYDRLALIR
jgi:signal peptidase I